VHGAATPAGPFSLQALNHPLLGLITPECNQNLIQDDIIQDGNYDVLDILKKEYGEEQAEQYFKRWAADQVGFSVKQSPW